MPHGSHLPGMLCNCIQHKNCPYPLHSTQFWRMHELCETLLESTEQMAEVEPVRAVIAAARVNLRPGPLGPFCLLVDEVEVQRRQCRLVKAVGASVVAGLVVLYNITDWWFYFFVLYFTTFSNLFGTLLKFDII